MGPPRCPWRPRGPRCGGPWSGWPASGAAASTAEAGTAEGSTAEAGTAEGSTAQAGTAEGSTAGAGTAEAGTAEGGGPLAGPGPASRPADRLSGPGSSGPGQECAGSAGGRRRLDRQDPHVATGQDGRVGAAARAQRNRPVGLELLAAGAAPAPGGDLADLQPGPGQARPLGGRAEVEPDRVGAHAGKRADLQ